MRPVERLRLLHDFCEEHGLRFHTETAAEAAERIEAFEAALRDVRGALETCAKTFRRYGELHRAKGTTEGNLKASNNDDLAEFCEGVLAKAAALSSGEPKPEQSTNG